MAYKNITLAFCVFVSLFVKTAFSQSVPMLDNLQQYGTVNPQEKVYLHFDKPHYLTGDDVWIKGYVTIGAQNQLSAMSNILYVDLVSPSNKVITNLKLQILHGTAIGDMHLADTLEEGTYHLRAYTNWMRNLPEETFFNKAFVIGKLQPDPVMVQNTFTYNETLKQLITSLVITGPTGVGLAYTALNYNITFADKISASGTAKTDNEGKVTINFNNSKNLELKTGVLSLKLETNGRHIQKDIALIVQPPENKISFMPEGGNMVADISGRIAFKMLQPDGFAASGSGYITDETGAKITEFTSGYAGMGSFYFMPQAGKNYKAVITYSNGKTQTTNLPAAVNEGYSLSLYQHVPATNISVAIKASPALVKNQQVTLLVQRQGKILFVVPKVISEAESLIKLPLDNCPSGIIQITLFNENMQAVCERLFFNINNRTALKLTTTGTEQHYKARQPVTITLKAGDVTDSLKVGSFSASVVNLTGLPQLKGDETGILPGLLLSPELKGYVERPDHYFEVYDNDHVTELDNLILCQGWRRIVWDDIKADKMPAINFPRENSFSISGSVTQRNGTPATKSKVMLLSTNSFGMLDTVTDAKGHFVFDRLLLKDKNRFAVRAKDPAGKIKLLIKLDEQPALSNLLPNNEIQYPDDAAYQAFLKRNYQQQPDSVKLRFSTYNMLNQVDVLAIKDKRQGVSDYSANLNGPGRADQVFLAEQMKTSFDLKQFLEGRALGVRFEGDTPYTTRGSAMKIGGPFGRNPTDPMMVYLDGVRMDQDPGFVITDISVDDVSSIEILRSIETTAVYGHNDGIIIITTKVGQVQNNEVKASKEYAPLALNGYNTIREFYSPEYAVPAKTQQGTDHRVTIFWKPDIITDRDGNASFKFYTSDDKGTYQLNIQGITPDGHPAQLTQTINVD